MDKSQLGQRNGREVKLKIIVNVLIWSSTILNQNLKVNFKIRNDPKIVLYYFGI